MAAIQAPPALVIVEYEDLVNDVDLSARLLEAWGDGALGVVGIRGVPNWCEKYRRVLQCSHPLAHLPEEVLKSLEHEPSMYNAGWSHGKEKLGEKPDTAKGSFYFNPLSNQPGTPEDREKFPWAMPENLWPSEQIPDLEPAAKDLGRAMREAVTHLARLVDRTVCKSNPDCKVELAKLMSETEKCKGRLLYYYPPKAPEGGTAAQATVSEDGWIGWHNDSGFFTALTPDIFVDEATGEIVPNPDPEGAGLWVVNREGKSVRVKIPADCLCVQVGECTQVVTGGALVATPHCVRGCRPELTGGRAIARVSCPCFIDSHPTFPLAMPEGCRREDVLSKGLSTKVPPLGDRWTEDGQTFGGFLHSSFLRYYDWALRSPAASAGA